MHGGPQSQNLSSGRWLTAPAALATITVCALLLTFAPAAPAQSYNVIYSFSSLQGCGVAPASGLTFDRSGALYGTTTSAATVFKLTYSASGWNCFPLYTFRGGDDGDSPQTRVIFGPDGTLFGNTRFGGGGTCDLGEGCGTAFQLMPSATACRTGSCGWSENVLHRFQGTPDGFWPMGDQAIDQAGNVYGATYEGGQDDVGEIYKLTRSSQGWSKSTVYSFPWPDDGHGAAATSVMLGADGNLYGTTEGGGDYNEGTVFQLAPSGSGWTETVLHSLTPDEGYYPEGGLIADSSGNLYGTVCCGGARGGGAVFELAHSNGAWTFSILYSFPGRDFGPFASLVMDANGNLYGTSYGHGAYGSGMVFKLVHSAGAWTFTSLHDFTGGSDGGEPNGSLIFDASGNLYGTATEGGSGGRGVAFEITP